MFSELDDMKGLSENIIMGQLAPTGTGAFDLLLDESMLQDACEVWASALPCSILLWRDQGHRLACLPRAAPLSKISGQGMCRLSMSQLRTAQPSQHDRRGHEPSCHAYAPESRSTARPGIAALQGSARLQGLHDREGSFRASV